MTAETLRHVHKPQGRYDTVRPDGIRDVWWKCMCGLEERRFFDGAACVAVRYRYQASPWYDATDLLMLHIPSRLCESCGGEGCDDCGVGVVEPDGSRIEAPPEPAPALRRVT